MFKKNHALLAFVALTVVLSTTFQNCSEGFRSAAGLNSLGNEDNTSMANVIIPHEHPDARTSVKKAEAQPLYMNRKNVHLILQDVFGDSINAESIPHLGWASGDLGGAWSPYQVRQIAAAACNNNPTLNYYCRNTALDMRSAPNTGTSSSREGRRLSICHHSVNQTDSLSYALDRIQSGASLEALPDVSTQNFQRLFDLFFRGRPYPETRFFDSLKILVERSESAEEGWKMAILTMCTSPHWQVL